MVYLHICGSFIKIKLDERSSQSNPEIVSVIDSVDGEKKCYYFCVREQIFEFILFLSTKN